MTIDSLLCKEDYSEVLIVPQKELKQLITDEIKAFNQEIADKSSN